MYSKTYEINFQFDFLTFTYTRKKSNRFITHFPVDIDDVESHLQMEVIEWQNYDTFKSDFTESNELKTFYSCLSETDFKEIQSIARKMISAFKKLLIYVSRHFQRVNIDKINTVNDWLTNTQTQFYEYRHPRAKVDINELEGEIKHQQSNKSL